VGRRGRKRQLDPKTEYWGLLESGVGTAAACKLLGIGRKTGYRWRAKNGGLPPARPAESSRSSRFLSLLERQRIATLRARRLGVREIAAAGALAVDGQQGAAPQPAPARPWALRR
jgi:transposase, IS30 family